MSNAREPRTLFRHLVATRPPRERRSAAAAAAASIGFHGLLVAGLAWLTMAVVQPAQAAKDERLVLYTPVAEAPPPPPPVAPRMDVPKPPAVMKVIARMEQEVPKVKPTVTEAEPKGFRVLTPPAVTPPDIPPPAAVAPIREADFSGEGVAGGSSKGSAPVALAAEKKVSADDISAAPAFTPYTVAPRLKNRDEVARALQRYYPDMLRDAGIGGKVLVWFLIDESGHVRKFQVKESSGHDAFDKAALKVADVMEFTPALNRDQKVPVWVALPVVFSTGQGAGE